MTMWVRERLVAPCDRSRGQGLVEYAVLIALVAVVAIATVQAFGGGVASMYQHLLSSLSPAV